MKKTRVVITRVRRKLKQGLSSAATSSNSNRGGAGTSWIERTVNRVEDKYTAKATGDPDIIKIQMRKLGSSFPTEYPLVGFMTEHPVSQQQWSSFINALNAQCTCISDVSGLRSKTTYFFYNHIASLTLKSCGVVPSLHVKRKHRKHSARGIQGEGRISYDYFLLLKRGARKPMTAAPATQIDRRENSTTSARPLARTFAPADFSKEAADLTPPEPVAAHPGAAPPGISTVDVFVNAILARKFAEANRLLEAIPDALLPERSSGPNGWAPMHAVALAYGNPFLANYVSFDLNRDEKAVVLAAKLLERGGNAVALVNSAKKYSPLDIALSSGFRELVELLLKVPGVQNHLSEEGWISLHFAVWKSAGPNEIIRSNMILRCLQVYESPDINIQDRIGWTALMWAIHRGAFFCAQMLLERGARADIHGQTGESALTLACRQGNEKLCSILLQSLGNEIDIRDSNGWTPLHLVAWKGFTPVASMLVDAGADLYRQTNSGETPYQIAERFQHSEDLLYLLS